MRKLEIFRKITLAYLLYGRGTVWIGLIWDVVQKYFYLTGSVFFTQYVANKTIPFGIVIWSVPIYYLLCFFIGYWDYKHGIWKIQNDLQNRELTPMFGNLEKNVNESKIKIEEILSLIKKGEKVLFNKNGH